MAFVGKRGPRSKADAGQCETSSGAPDSSDLMHDEGDVPELAASS